MTLKEYEARIETLGRREIATPIMKDHYTEGDGREFESDAVEAAYLLAHLSVEIRRIAWTRDAWHRARDLAARADALASEIAAEVGLMFSNPLPRFPGGMSGGISYPTIN